MGLWHASAVKVVCNYIFLLMVDYLFSKCFLHKSAAWGTVLGTGNVRGEISSWLSTADQWDDFMKDRLWQRSRKLKAAGSMESVSETENVKATYISTNGRFSMNSKDPSLRQKMEVAFWSIMGRSLRPIKGKKKQALEQHSQPVGHNPFGGWMTLSQGSPKAIRKHRYLHYYS